MNSVSMTSGSIADVLAALQSLGFTVDTSTGIARWTADTNNKIYLKAETSGSNTLLKVYKSSNTLIHNGVTMVASTAKKMMYEKIGDSVVFGFANASNTGNIIQYIIAEPKDTADHWLYVIAYMGNGDSNAAKVIDGATENVINMVTYQLYAGSANGIQLCKYYDGIRFVENLFETSVCASVPNIYNANSTFSTNNYIEATIGTDTFLVINPTAGATNTKVAIKKTLLTS